MKKTPAHQLALHLERSGYFPLVRDLAKGFTAPIWWHDPERPAGTCVRQNGTGVFVNTGAADLLVTCDHVYDAWTIDRDAAPALRCQIGSAVFDPVDRLLDRDRRLDLAVLKASDVLANSAQASIHHALRWPPEPVVEGEVVMLGGFPGQYRAEADSTSDFGFITFLTRVVDSTRDRIVCSLQLDEAFSTQGERLREGFSYAGASGGPVYRIREGALTTLELVGFIYEYAPTLDALLARPVSMLNERGYLHRSESA